MAYVNRILQIPVSEILDQLQKKFADKDFEGQTNYEDFMRYLQGAKMAREAMLKDEEDMVTKQKEAEEKRNNRRQSVRPASNR